MAMRARLEEFALTLHPEKTRLIEFGRHATALEQRGLGKPETFNFLGFTFICGKSRLGDFLVKRKTRRDRMMAKLLEIKEELRWRMHRPIPEQGQWLRQVVSGFFNYHAVPTNGRDHSPPSVTALRLSRQRARGGVARRIARRGTEWPGWWTIGSPDHASFIHGQACGSPSGHPSVGAVCGKAARTVLCGGRSVMGVPTAIRPRRP